MGAENAVLNKLKSWTEDKFKTRTSEDITAKIDDFFNMHGLSPDKNNSDIRQTVYNDLIRMARQQGLFPTKPTRTPPTERNREQWNRDQTLFDKLQEPSYTFTENLSWFAALYQQMQEAPAKIMSHVETLAVASLMQNSTQMESQVEEKISDVVALAATTVNSLSDKQQELIVSTVLAGGGVSDALLAVAKGTSAPRIEAGENHEMVSRNQDHQIIRAISHALTANEERIRSGEATQLSVVYPDKDGLLQVLHLDINLLLSKRDVAQQMMTALCRLHMLSGGRLRAIITSPVQAARVDLLVQSGQPLSPEAFDALTLLKNDAKNQEQRAPDLSRLSIKDALRQEDMNANIRSTAATISLALPAANFVALSNIPVPDPQGQIDYTSLAAGSFQSNSIPYYKGSLIQEDPFAVLDLELTTAIRKINTLTTDIRTPQQFRSTLQALQNSLYEEKCLLESKDNFETIKSRILVAINTANNALVDTRLAENRHFWYTNVVPILTNIIKPLNQFIRATGLSTFTQPAPIQPPPIQRPPIQRPPIEPAPVQVDPVEVLNKTREKIMTETEHLSTEIFLLAAENNTPSQLHDTLNELGISLLRACNVILDRATLNADDIDICKTRIQNAINTADTAFAENRPFWYTNVVPILNNIIKALNQFIRATGLSASHELHECPTVSRVEDNYNQIKEAYKAFINEENDTPPETPQPNP